MTTCSRDAPPAVATIAVDHPPRRRSRKEQKEVRRRHRSEVDFDLDHQTTTTGMHRAAANRKSPTQRIKDAIAPR
jgi:hypothetical protein